MLLRPGRQFWCSSGHPHLSFCLASTGVFGCESNVVKGYKPSQVAPPYLLWLAMNFGKFLKEGRSRRNYSCVGWTNNLFWHPALPHPKPLAQNLVTPYTLPLPLPPNPSVSEVCTSVWSRGPCSFPLFPFQSCPGIFFNCPAPWLKVWRQRTRDGRTECRHRRCKPSGKLSEHRWVWSFLFWQESGQRS